MRIFLAICMFMLVCIDSYAQENKITGKVTDKSGMPLTQVVIKAYGKDGKNMSAYTLSGKDGKFSIGVKDEWLPIRVVLSCLGYRQKTVVVKNIGERNMRVVMDEEAVRLNEVTVKSAPIRVHGDTLVYNVASFKSASDRTIEDVLKKMPGITVQQNGQILYQGESINKFYIEGLDLLSGRYALATRNISPDDIASVSVYENHQPQKVLKDLVYSDKAALNLKLKNNRMLKPVGTLTGGVGYGDHTLWTGELYGMLISPGNQHLITAKANNFGNAYTGETEILASESGTPAETAALNVFPHNPFGTVNVPTERYYDNRSVTSSFNSIFKLNNDRTLTVNGDYRNDRNDYSNSRVSGYALGGNEYLVVTEDNSSATDVHEANLGIKIENNADKVYYMENLKLRGRFNRNNYTVDNGSLLMQGVNTNDFNISNLFNISLRRKQRVWQFNSLVSFADTPLNNLSAEVPSQDSLVVTQGVKGMSFKTVENTSVQWAIDRYSSLAMTLSFTAAYDDFSSTLTRYGESSVNSNRGYDLATVVTPKYQYARGKVRIEVNVPIMMRDISYKNLVDNTRFTLDKPYLGLRSYIKYFIRNSFTSTLSVGYRHTFGNITNFAIAPIFTTYRTQTTLGTGILSKGENAYAMFEMDYRNTLDGIFATLKCLYQDIGNNIMTGSNVSEDETQTVGYYRDNKTHVWNANAYLAKNFSSIDMTVSLTGNIMSTRKNLVRQDMEYALTNNVYGVRLDMSNSFFNEIITTNLHCDYTYSTQNLGLAGMKNRQHLFTGALNVSAFPVKDVEIYANASYNINTIENTQSNLYINCGARYIGRRFDVELSVKNLTNRKYYTTRSFLDNDIYSYVYELRPLEFMVTAKYKF